MNNIRIFYGSTDSTTDSTTESNRMKTAGNRQNYLYVDGSGCQIQLFSFTIKTTA